MSAYNFFVSGAKFTTFFLLNLGWIVVDNLICLSSSILEIFAIEVWSCTKSRQILDGFALPNSKGAVTPKLYPRYHACLAARHTEKFSEVAPPSPKIIGPHTPNFKPILECSLLKKLLGAPPSQVGCVLASLGHSQARVKIWASSAPVWAKIWSSEKVDLGVSQSTCSMVLLVDQSSPDFFRRMREESLLITCLFGFGYLYSFRRYLQANFEFEVVRNLPTFCTFLAPSFFGESPPNSGT